MGYHKLPRVAERRDNLFQRIINEAEICSEHNKILTEITMNMDWKQFGGSEKGAEKQALCLMLEKATEAMSILNHRSIHRTKNWTNLESENTGTQMRK